MKQYQLDLIGQSPLLMHADNLNFDERVREWRDDPTNHEQMKGNNGSDKVPAWRWIGYTYNNGDVLGVPSDNILTMLREGGVKVPAKKGTYKKQTQAGILIDQIQFTLRIKGN